MQGIWGNAIVIAVLVAILALVVRALWKNHKAGGHCSGDCGSCSGCHCKDSKIE